VDTNYDVTVDSSETVEIDKEDWQNGKAKWLDIV
jgi:hypothetical protein